MNRRATLPRHLNSLFPSLRMPRPPWTCGWPKLSVSSHKASRHSILSFLGSSCSRRSTFGSMVSNLAKHLPELFGCHGDQFSRPLEAPVTTVGGFIQGCDLFGRRLVFALRVVGGFDLHFTQGDNFRPAHNPDVFAPGGGHQPPTQVFFCVRDRESLHIDFIQTPISLVKKRWSSGLGAGYRCQN